MPEQTPPYPTTGNPCAYKRCPEPAWTEDPKGLCLYHSPENGKTKDTARLVWQHARAETQQPNPDYSGWHFPDDPDREWFQGLTFRGEVVFSDAEFEGPSPGRLREFIRRGGSGDDFPLVPRFDGAHFEGQAFFPLARFKGIPSFTQATFESCARFDWVSFESAAHFKKAHFIGSAVFSQASFGKSAFFSGAEFRETAKFDRVNFGTAADFKKAKFLDGAIFQWSVIARHAWFYEIKFCGDASFGNVTFGGDARFDGAEFFGLADFTGASCKPGHNVHFDRPRRDGRPFRQRAQGETAYLLAKQAAKARGDLDRADWYGYWCWCAKAAGRVEICGAWDVVQGCIRWIVLKLTHHPFVVLFFAGVVILLCGLLFWAHAGIMPSGSEDLAFQPGFGKCLYFSAVTFTTLGYGDFQPKPGFFRALAGTEAFSGAALMALFIVALTRKYMR